MSVKPMSRNNDHLRSDDGQTDRPQFHLYRLGPSGKMGRVKITKAIVIIGHVCHVTLNSPFW